METENNSVMIWQDGAPQNKWFAEWFIAKLDNGQKVVLKRLSEENSYDFTTADETYYKEFRIAKWMNFPESEFFSPAAMQLIEALEESHKRILQLLPSCWSDDDLCLLGQIEQAIKAAKGE